MQRKEDCRKNTDEKIKKPKKKKEVSMDTDKYLVVVGVSGETAKRYVNVHARSQAKAAEYGLNIVCNEEPMNAPFASVVSVKLEK